MATRANIVVKHILPLRGNTAQSEGYTGLVGEITVDTELDTLRIHDGTVAGGRRLATYAELESVATGNIDLTGYATNANVTAANLAISTLNANIGAFHSYANATFTAGGTTYSNTNVAAYLVANPQSGTYSNVNVQAYLGANVGAFHTYANVTFSTVANAALAHSEIDGLRANITAANTAIGAVTTAWQANAATQAGLISSNYNTLIANTALAHNEIDGLRANITAANVSIASLQSNAGTQQTQINSINANVAAANAAIAAIQTGSGFATVEQITANIATVTAAWTANATTQATDINALRANVTAANTSIGAVTTAWTANAGTQQTQIDTLQTQVYTNTNTAAYLAGNVVVGNLTVSADAVVLGNMRVQGTQTTVNAATLTVNDLWVTVANGAAQASDANGAGLRVAGALANIAYSSVNDTFDFNKPITVDKLFTSNITSGDHSWQFGSNSKLVFPPTTFGMMGPAPETVSGIEFNTNGIPKTITDQGDLLRITVGDNETASWWFGNDGNVYMPSVNNNGLIFNWTGTTFDFTRIAAEGVLTNPSLVLRTGDINSGQRNAWTFDSTGVLTTPGAIRTSTINNTGSGRVTIDPDGDAFTYIRVDGWDDGGERVVISNQRAAAAGIYFYTQGGNTFRMSDTQFMFPDSTWQSTAWTGTVANLTSGGNVVALGSDGNLTLPTNWNFETSPAVSGTGIVFGDGTYQYTAWTGKTNRLSTDTNNITLEANGDLTIVNTIKPQPGQYYLAQSDTSTEMSWANSVQDPSTGVYSGIGTDSNGVWTSVASTDALGNWIAKDMLFDMSGNLTVPGAILPTTDNTQDLGSATNRFRHLYVGPGTVYVGNAAIKTTATGNLILPGLTRAVASSAYAEEIDDRGDQTQTFTTVPTVIDNATYQRLNGGPVSGFTSAEYSVDQLDGDGYIDGISIDSPGSGYADAVEELARENMWATEVADPINNFNASDWTQIPFQVQSRAGESEYEFDAGGVDTGYISFESGGNNAGIYNNQGGEVYISNRSFITEEAETAYVRIPAGDSSNALQLVQEQGIVEINANGKVWEFGINGRMYLPASGSIEFQDGTIQTTAYTGGGGGSVDGLTGNTNWDPSQEGDTAYELDINNQIKLRTTFSGNLGPGIGLGSGAGLNAASGVIAIGNDDVGLNGKQGGVYIGYQAGWNDSEQPQGEYAIAIGARAARNIALDNSITLNATGEVLDPDQAGLFIKPIREEQYDDLILYYNANSGEVTYAANPGGGASVGNTAPTSSTGRLWYNTDDGRLYVRGLDTWIDASPSVVPGNMVGYDIDGNITLRDDASINFANGVSITSTYGNTQVAGFMGAFTGNITKLPGGYEFSSTITGIQLGTETFVTLADGVFGGPIGGTVTISGVVGTTEINGTWGYESWDSNLFLLFDNAESMANVDSSSWGNYVSGGTVTSLGPQILELKGDSVRISTHWGTQWIFDPEVGLIFPDETIQTTAYTGGSTNLSDYQGNIYINSESSGLIIDAAGDKRVGFMKYFGMEASFIHANGPTKSIPFQIGRVEADDITQANISVFTSEVYIAANGKVGINTTGPADQLDVAGSIRARGVLYTMPGIGGLVFANVGDASSGSISVDSGGYLQAATSSGFVAQVSGRERIRATNADTTISAGNDVVLTANSEGVTHSWTFDTNGNITLPSGSIISENNGLILTPSGASSEQKLKIYPTQVEGDHLHLSSGNLATTSIFLGTDSQYIRTNTDGSMVIGTADTVPDSPGAGYRWTFGADGSTTFPEHMPVTITGNLTVGNLFVNGNTTTINTSSYVVSDNIIQMADGNPADTLDIGFVGHRTVNGTLEHTGFVRDASTGMWTLFSNVTTQPTATVDMTEALLDSLQVRTVFGNVELNGGYINFSASPIAGTDGITFSDGSFQGSAYGNTQVAAYLVENPQGSTYSNTNVAAYLVENPQSGTYGDSNVAAYLVANPQGSTYSNTNVAAYLTTATINTSGNITAANIVTSGATSGNISGANYISANVFQVSSGIFWANGTAWSSSGGGTTYTSTGAGNITVSGSTLALTAAGPGAVTTGSSTAIPVVTTDAYGRVSTITTAAVVAPAGTLTGTTLASGVVTSSLTTVGTLGSLAVTGNVTAGNVSATQLTATGNVVAANIVTTGTYGNITGANIISANNITISGFGVTMTNRPAFRVYGTYAGAAGGWASTSNVNLKGDMLTVDYNQGNYFNVTTGVFTAPVAGLYTTTLVARVGSNNGTNQLGVFKNGNTSGTSSANVACFWETDTNTGTSTHFGTTGTIRLAVGDFLSANIVTGNINFDGYDSWTVSYIG